MLNKSLENKIYKYFDKHGIPFESFAKITLSWEKNIYNEDYISSEIEHNLNSPASHIQINAPFELEESELNAIVINYIYETTGVMLEDIGQLITNPTYKGVPFLLQLNEHDGTRKVSLAKKTIPGSLIVRPDYNNVGLTTLGSIERINGDLGICDAPIQNLGKLSFVKADLWITRYDDLLQLESLAPLVEVGGNLVINDKNITSLGTVETVKGNLNLRKSAISDLSALKFIGGNFLGRREIFQDYNFSDIEIKGKIRLYKD